MNVNPRAWLIWVTSAAILAMVAQNPLYSLTILLIAVLVNQVHGFEGNGLSLPVARIALIVIAFSAIYTATFVHEGSTVLFTLPGWPLLGGSITLEAIVEGASNGLALVALLAVFTALNAIVPVSELVRLIPGALHDIGVVILVAITYIPETRRQLVRIRQAQEIRGHELHGIRDWQPIVVPLLVGGLERSMQLAETMVARGYGATTNEDSTFAERAVLLGGLLIALLGWILALWIGWPGWILLGVAALGVVLLLYRRGRQHRRTRFKAFAWDWQASGIVLVSLLAMLMVVVPWPWSDRTSLSYSPFPHLSWPIYDLFIGLALVLLSLPAIVVSRRN